MPLTIAIATLDEHESFYFTTKMLPLYHPAADCDFLCLDQSPDTPDGKANANLVTKKLRKRFRSATYEFLREPRGVGPARNAIFAAAKTDWVLVLDSHVALWPGALERLKAFIGENPDCRDLLTGPLVSDDGKTLIGTHQELRWRAEAFGTWAVDERGNGADSAPFEIPTMGLGLFACRRDAYPGFHPDQRGFGCCEAAFCQQFRERGDRVLCCPWLRWEHYFRPAVVGGRFGKPPYELHRVDKITNAMLEFSRCGMDPAGILDHFSGSLNTLEMRTLNERLNGHLQTPANGRPADGD